MWWETHNEDAVRMGTQWKCYKYIAVSGKTQVERLVGGKDG
jgi:hypothetical protein